MHGEHVENDSSRLPDTSLPASEADPATVDLLRRLLALAPPTARRIRDEAVRRRARRPQVGPRLDL